MTQTVLSYYPLTGLFMERLEAAHGKVDSYQPIGAIRNLGMRRLYRSLHGIKADRILIAVENDNGRPLVVPLRIVAAATRGRQVAVVWPDTTLEVMPWWTVFPLLWRLLFEQIKSRVMLRCISAQMKRKSSRHTLPKPSARSYRGQVVFLDANLSFGLSAGGSVGHIKGVVDELIEEGFSVRYISTKPIPTEKTGASHVAVPYPSLLAFPAELNYYVAHYAFDRVARREVRAQPVDFIYQRMSLHNISGVDIARRAQVPLIVEYNGSEAWTAANWGKKLALHDTALAAEKYILEAADLLVTVSESLANELRAQDIPEERIVTYPNCIDPTIFSLDRFDAGDCTSLRERLGIRPDACVATFIGTFGTWHGIDFLANAIRNMVDRDRDFLDQHKLHFLLIGDGLKKAEVLQAVGQPPYSAYVTMPGLVQQARAPAYLAISDIFLSPHLPNSDGSPFFGSPTKLFEYMAMGKPIVASDLDQIGTVLRGEFFGPSDESPLAFLFKPGCEEAMLEALRLALEDRSTADDMAHRARAYALKNFTWHHHIGAIRERLDSLGLFAQT